MTKEKTLKVVVLNIGRDDYSGEPFRTLVADIAEAWDQIPEEFRGWAEFSMDYNGLKVWYNKPETEEDVREREEYERLKQKFENS